MERIELIMKLKNNGITLISLVVTIIVLLILVGISIAQLTGNGLFQNAKLAKEKSEEAEAKENATLGDYENKIGEYLDSTRQDNINSTWKKYMMNDDGYITGQEECSLPEKFSELYIEVEYQTVNTIHCYSFTILYENLYDDFKEYHSGFYNTTGHTCTLHISKTKIGLVEVIGSNKNVKDQCKMKIFYK